MDAALESVVRFRPMEPGDVNFVLDSWIRSYRESPWAGVVPNHRFFEVMHEAIEGLIARGTKVVVACAKTDTTRILGWVAYERLHDGVACHYVYVKDPFRRRGLATELLKHATAQVDARHFYTFRTRQSAYFPGWQYEPAIARRK